MPYKVIYNNNSPPDYPETININNGFIQFMINETSVIVPLSSIFRMEYTNLPNKVAQNASNELVGASEVTINGQTDTFENSFSRRERYERG